MAKNFEVFKTPEEQARGYERYCKSHGMGCSKCPLRKVASTRCPFEWLELEYEENPKPCPFCGHTEVDIVLSGCHGGFDACCKNCGATVIDKSKTEVIKKWNRRAQ